MGLDDKPRHKILCRRKYYTYVVACMHNCKEPNFCREFWSFFRTKGLSLANYYNEDGIGDEIMRRVVFDCDRCGKRELTEVYGLYNREGEGEENLLGDDERFEQVTKVGHNAQLVEALTFGTLRSLEGGLGWVHYCRRCFMTVSDNLAKIANIKKPAKVKPRPGLPAADDPGREPVEDPSKLAERSRATEDPDPSREPVEDPSKLAERSRATVDPPDPSPEPVEDPSKLAERSRATVAPQLKPKLKSKKKKAKAKAPDKKKTSGDLPLTRGGNK